MFICTCAILISTLEWNKQGGAASGRPQRRVWSGPGSGIWSQPGEQAPESGASAPSITEPQDTSPTRKQQQT